jgi:hypothetical protein
MYREINNMNRAVVSGGRDDALFQSSAILSFVA